ncbi:hypothetical protein [Hydrogenophaga sp.]|uniref:hypothetical protein n=1 Tax=Hydrogenophaga sp. TaxID=1904254 RepID=UPI0027219C2A|nr:hypothetical protein [Hydrogenophaga sp.]MDO8903941.1 hypothetical protein [Hydrogenophaga sp.]
MLTKAQPYQAVARFMQAFQQRIQPFWWVAMLLLAGYWSLLAGQHISTSNIKGDAGQNLQIAVHLYQHGEFSMASTAGFQPTNFREPLPIVVTALYLKASGRNHDYMTLDNLRSGEPARFVKLHNLGWVFLGLIATWLLFNELTTSRWAGGLAAGSAFIFFFNNPYVVDSLYTELVTGVLMTGTSYLMLLAGRRQKGSLWLATGVGLGLLCLTKSAFLYISLVTIVVLATVMLLQRGARARPWLAAGFMTLGLICTTAPWMIRNQLLFDSAEISSGRSGWVLYKRALLNRITPEEFRLAFTLFGPRLYQDLVAGTSLAITPEDAKLRTGRVSRLYAGRSEFSGDDMRAQGAGDPDRAVTLYRKTSAMYIKLSREMEQAGDPHPTYAADRALQAIALPMLKEEPLAHLKLSILMFWRGMWSIPPQLQIPLLPEGRWRSGFIEVINALGVLALLGCFVWGMLQRNVRLLAFTMLPVMMMAFYTLLSQNLPRFFAPTQPIMLVALLLLVFQLIGGIMVKTKQD